MNDNKILEELKEKYESTQTSTELKLLIDTFLEHFPIED